MRCWFNNKNIPSTFIFNVDIRDIERNFIFPTKSKQHRNIKKEGKEIEIYSTKKIVVELYIHEYKKWPKQIP
ncbi:hypothetical protein DFQ12_1676 [Sphingobacterium detergens]|uniref:Uncharacterized protein n=1 Tax=Sphingobacterium detergens TaxID=1145106 RepID=A0A420BJE8_SPHD1|nr:hypothetical protein DFQ12_1676 [Sphingobacterium detergens]